MEKNQHDTSVLNHLTKDEKHVQCLFGDCIHLRCIRYKTDTFLDF